MLSRRNLLLATAASVPLGACGWLGQEEGPPLPGTRHAVLMTDSGPVPDSASSTVAVQLGSPSGVPEWPQADGNAAHAAPRAAGSGNLGETWRTSIGASSSSTSPILGPPVVAQGRLFAIDADGRITAVDAGSGDQVWSQRIGALGKRDRLAGGALTYDNGKIFVAFASGWVVGLDANSGQEIWRRSVQSPLRTSPTAVSGNVLVRTGDNQLYSLNPATGELRWRHAGAYEQAGILGGAPPAVAGNTVVVAYSSGEVFGLLVDDGRELWTDTVLRARGILALDTITDITAAPVIIDNTVYVAGGAGEMAAFLLDRGSRVWDADVTALQTPCISGNAIFLVNERGELVCLLRETGRVRWVQRIADAAALRKVPSDASWSGPILVGDSLIVTGSTGDVLSFSPYDGSFKQRYDNGTPYRLPPVVAAGTVYALDEKARVTALR